jgi:hypothetical protein
MSDNSNNDGFLINSIDNNDKILEILNVKISNLNELKEFINSGLETIILNFNNIIVCDLNELPNNIENIIIENNMIEIEEINFNKHKWNKIVLKNSNIKNINKKNEINEINDLTCNILDLSENELSSIIFNNCKINELYLSESNIEKICFNNCEILKLDLSNNRLEEIIDKNFPDNLIKLDLSNNLINKVGRLSDTIIKLNLSNNLLEKIEILPKNLEKLELNNNRLTTFNNNLLSSDIKYFDITDNCIKNNSELFKDLQSEQLFYDTDEEDDSDSDSDISIKFTNYKFGNNGIEEDNKSEKIIRVFDNLIPVEMKWKIRL